MMQLKDRVRNVINEHLNFRLNPEDDESPLIENGMDSLDVITTLMLIEDEFELDIPDEKVEDLFSVSRITNYLIERGVS